MPDFTRNNPRIRRLYLDVVYNAAGNVAVVNTVATFVGWEVNTVLSTDFGDTDKVQPTTKNYNAIESPGTTVSTAVGGGLVATRAQLYDLLRVDAIARPAV